MNIKLAEKVLKTCQELGVAEYCVCAGARNSPLVFLLAQAQGVRLHHFFEERSASFFALGRIKKIGVPVAVVTTSGTAVAELLPAAVEATYAGLPLLLVTADRPRSYRGTGAPQAIDQTGIFSKYVQTTWDIADLDESLPFEDWSQTQPLHINVCFGEPLIDAPIQVLELSPASEIPLLDFTPSQNYRVQKPFVIVGGLRPKERPLVRDFLLKLKAPIYAEAISGLRGDPQLSPRLLHQGEKMAARLFANSSCQSVLRIGSVPTVRFWRDLEDQFVQTPVYSISKDDWTGLSRSAHHVVGLRHIHSLKVEGLEDSSLQQIFSQDETLYRSFQPLLQAHPRSEVSLVHQLSHRLAGQGVYLGNSLPIREWDLVAARDLAVSDIEANRGANGIDGQISTFLGWSEGSATEAWGVIGDLTALYDLSAPWISRTLSPQVRRRLVIINNQGGQIFKNIFKNDAFLNQHGLDFRNWAAMWGWDYQLWNEIPSSFDFSPANLVIELKPDPVQSDQFWQGYQSL